MFKNFSGKQKAKYIVWCILGVVIAPLAVFCGVASTLEGWLWDLRKAGWRWIERD